MLRLGFRSEILGLSFWLLALSPGVLGFSAQVLACSFVAFDFCAEVGRFSEVVGFSTNFEFLSHSL